MKKLIRTAIARIKLVRREVVDYYDDLYFRFMNDSYKNEYEEEFSPYEEILERLSYLEKDNYNLYEEIRKLNSSLTYCIDNLNVSKPKPSKKATNNCKSLE
jgi:hypothetical protein